MANTKKSKTASAAGLPRPEVTVGPADPVRARIARRTTGAGGFGGRSREAGMLIDTSQVAAPYSTGYKLEAYRTSYAYGLSDRTGAYDIPTYFVQMNEQNGGMLYWPVTLHEKYSWYRYWSRCIYLDSKHLGNVLMADGTERDIRKIVAGDQVVTANGNIKVVAETYKRMTESHAFIVRWAGDTGGVMCTHHHPFYVKSEKGFEKKFARYIVKGDFVASKIPDMVVGSDLTEDVATLLGYFASEGSFNKLQRKPKYLRPSKRGNGSVVATELDGQDEYSLDGAYYKAIRFTINENEVDTIGKDLEGIVERLCGKKINIHHDKREYKGRKNKTTEIVVNDVDLATLCLKHCGSGARTKKLSGELVFAEKNIQMAFLRAYIAGDGEKSKKGSCRISTTSCDMASQVRLMLARCSFPTIIQKGMTKTSGCVNVKIGRPYYHVCLSKHVFSLFSGNGGIGSGARMSTFIEDGFFYTKVLEVKDIGVKVDYTYNMSVEADVEEDRSYLLNGLCGSKNTDAYIGRALELLSDLPMSKLTLNMPKMSDDKKELSKEILDFFTYQLEVINAFEMCQNILWEMNMIGNAYIFHEWDEKKKMWSRAVMLPPEEVYVFQYPFTDNKRVEYRPQRLISLIKAQGTAETSSEVPKGDYDRSAMNEKIVEGVPKELRDMVEKEGCIVMDTDPLTGSFVHHIARRRSPYMDLGASVLERVLVPMLQKEHYRYTQLSLASRNMTPKNLVTAPGLMPEELNDLRTQVDLSYLDPEYSIITNYEVTWQQIGVQDRMLDFSREYEQIENQVFAALGVTRELLTGEGQFSGTKITVEILNTMFLLTREVLRNYIEKQLFIPICEAHGWFEEDKNGAKKYYYPQIGFNRLTIRDNAEVFDSLFQLYSKGSLPVEVIYELFNLNADEMHAKLLAGMFTAKDSTFNRTTEEVNTEVGRAIVQQTDIVEKVSKYLGLTFKGPPEQGGEGGEGGFQEGFGDTPQTDGGAAPEGEGGEQEAEPEKDKGQESEGSEPDPDALADEVAGTLSPDASEEDIQEAVDEADKAHGE